MTLAYTLNRLMNQQAVIERDEAKPDEYGAETKAEWKTLPAVRCKFWWWHSEGSRSGMKEIASPQRTVNYTGGGMMVPLGTDVTDKDRLLEIQDSAGNKLVSGPFRIVGVAEQATHLELSLTRP